VIATGDDRLNPHHFMGRALVAQLNSDRIRDEAGEKVLSEHLARKSASEVLACPGVVHFIGSVRSL
jgi:hypothetical protein